MENTGRITRALAPELRRIVFGATADDAIDNELPHAVEVDRAHVVMLAERGIVPPDRAAVLLGAITALRDEGFAPLRGRSAPRGLYLLYEDHLIETLGIDVGGLLQTARSRNDLGATTLRLRMRRPVHELLGAAARLLEVLCRKAEEHQGCVMPAYTHYQAAVPITLGHYLGGIGTALARDISWLGRATAEMDTCPLGAAAGGGTSFPIHPERTAALLGFTRPVAHSLDAVAARDVVLRLVSAAALLGVSLGRLATDLLLFTTAEFGFLTLPDHLVGSSSVMPQKRNPFLLEHLAGRSSTALGAFSAAALAMHGAPFTNSIAVGTEAVSQLWRALGDTTDALRLAHAVLEGAVPDPEAMRRRAVRGYTTATAFSEWLVAERGLAFRDAHRRVGTLVRAAVERDEDLAQAAARTFGEGHPAVRDAPLEPEQARAAFRHGGGPSAETLAACRERMAAAHRRLRARIEQRERRWKAAAAALEHAVDRIIDRVCREPISLSHRRTRHAGDHVDAQP